MRVSGNQESERYDYRRITVKVYIEHTQQTEKLITNSVRAYYFVSGIIQVFEFMECGSDMCNACLLHLSFRLFAFRVFKRNACLRNIYIM